LLACEGRAGYNRRTSSWRATLIHKVNGNTLGLKTSVRQRLERLYQRRVSPQQVISPELARTLSELSRECRRVIGILLDRKGNLEDVIVGDARGITISELGRYRVSRARFRGVRCIRTRLDTPGLTHDDLTDLALLRFDLMAVLEVLPDGLPGRFDVAYLVPEDHKFGAQRSDDRVEGASPWDFLPPTTVHGLDLSFTEFIAALESEFANSRRTQAVSAGTRRAILVGVTTGSLQAVRESMEELRELAASAGHVVVDEILQRRPQIDGKTVVGSGKIKDIFIRSLQLGADLIVFDRELSGSQARSIAQLTDLEVIDRTQLILDIFAQRAQSREGKIQVELAQLKYSLPRLVLKDDFMSRITGGIGAKGPGETKIEELKRLIQTRITRLERDIESLARGRDERRKKRESSGIPVVSIVGYTNAGKSTLLNSLTGSQVLAENRLFATLDPTTRRMRFPEERELIITDTVGFLRDLPEDLVAAFRATLEELREAHLILHLVDASNPVFAEQMNAVDDLMAELGIDNTPRLLVFNKRDRVDPDDLALILEEYDAIAISALDRDSLGELTQRIERVLWEESHMQVR
jgi:GTPase